MKRTTYLFVALCVLTVLVAIGLNGYAIYQSMESGKKLYQSFTQAKVEFLHSEGHYVRADAVINERNYWFDKEFFPSDSSIKVELQCPASEFYEINLYYGDEKQSHEVMNGFLLNDGMPVKIDGTSNTFLEGSAANEKLWNYQTRVWNYRRRLYDVLKTSGSSRQAIDGETELSHERQVCVDSLKSIVSEFLREDIAGIAKAVVASELKYFTSEEIVGVVDTAAVYWQHPLMQSLRKQYDNLKNYQCEGGFYIDEKAYTPQGKEVRLSQWVGKGHYTVLIVEDLPCLPYMRKSLQEVYDAYHEKYGLEVVTCYDESDYQYWCVKMKRNSYPGVSVNGYTSGKNNWSCYNRADGTLQILLFGPDGRVVGSCLSGDELLELLHTIYHAS